MTKCNEFWKFLEDKIEKKYPLTKWLINPYSRPGFITIDLTLNINGIGVYSTTFLDLKKLKIESNGIMLQILL